MQEDEVAQDVPLDRWRKAWPPLSSRLNRFVRQKPISRLPAREGRARRLASAAVGLRAALRDVVAQAVARQVEPVDRVTTAGARAGILVGRVALVDLELDGLGHARWESTSGVPSSNVRILAAGRSGRSSA